MIGLRNALSMWCAPKHPAALAIIRDEIESPTATDPIGTLFVGAVQEKDGVYASVARLALEIAAR